MNEVAHEPSPDPHHDVYSKTVFGFWVYLLTDFVLFGVMIATYEVLVHSTFGGPGAKDLFSMPLALAQTLVLLVASFFIGLAGAYAHQQKKSQTLLYLALTLITGIGFAVLGHIEFMSILQTGYSWKSSGFLSAYFTVIGTHRLHILFGLLWILVLGYPVLRKGVSEVSIKRLTCLRMFWQFLNIVWVFIFAIVYLLGVK